MSYYKRKATSTTFFEIKTMLPSFLDKFKNDFTNHPKEIFEKWPDIIGEKFAKWTKPISYEKGILKIAVKSSALYSLLVRYEKKRLLNMLKGIFPKASIRDLQFLIS